MTLSSLLMSVLHESGNMWLMAASYLLLGFGVAGLIHEFLPSVLIERHLRRGTYAPPFFAALFGVPLPLCSCGVLPAAVALRQKGANPGATAAFLIATPETGVDSVAMTWALMDPVMTVMRPVAAFTTAVSAGVMINLFPDARVTSVALPTLPSAPTTVVPACCQEDPPPSTRRNFFHRLRSALIYGYVDLVQDIAAWFIFGVLLSGVISVLVPATFIDTYLGNPWWGMLAMLCMGIPLYVCASASTPIAAALFAKGLNPGAVLVFLLAGPATNVASLTVIARMFGKRFVMLYIVCIALMTIAFGWTVNSLYAWLGAPEIKILQHLHGEHHSSTQWWAGLILAALMMYGLWRKYTKKSAADLVSTS